MKQTERNLATLQSVPCTSGMNGVHNWVVGERIQRLNAALDD